MKYILIVLLLFLVPLIVFAVAFLCHLHRQSKMTEPTNKKYRDSSDAIFLWEKPPYSEKGFEPYIMPYLIDEEAPAVVIVPGGGYTHVAVEKEGEATSRKLNEMGYHAIVLDYRIYPAVYPASHLDLIRTIQMVRGKQKQWKIKNGIVFVLGFSAGGHLSASLPAVYEELVQESGDLSHINALPNGFILGYPVTNFTRNIYGVVPFHVFLLGLGHKRGLKKRLSPEKQVAENYPPTYIWALKNDQLVNAKRNSITMQKAFEKAGVPHKLRIFPGKEHGSGLSVGMEAEIWLEEAMDFMEKTVL